ncbi:hypothetical protein NC653_016785 [Populus alba x Populus x berolinensis]|uniref:DUF4371 domain-containing protein n=1 Tax=Populus alba x Populus x berolinensis TaxID=444605 RepID=A0AAD6QNR8_9ROSI|nr:hypothetical protein NC653_016785 [Populus alba x Populus x berolinensis]
MAVVTRYVDNNGHIIEYFLGIQHVSNTTASSLKAAIEVLFSKHKLSISRLHDQGYDGAIGASCKRMEVIREKQYAKIIEGLKHGEISSGQGLNQETSLKRYGDTRWGSHYVTIIYLLAMFSSVLDVLDDHFTETSIELLLCMTCLSPNDSFSNFNKEKLIRLALFYPGEFFIVDLMVLGDQLDAYIINLRGDDEFSSIEDIASLVEKMVKTRRI